MRLEGKPRQLGSILPHAIQEYANPELEWLIHRQIYLHDIDVIQLDYLPMGQYRGAFQRLGVFLFEHDIYFQSIGRLLRNMRGIFKMVSAGYEYLRAIRYELRMLRHFDRVQVCTRANKQHLAAFAPKLLDRMDDNLRAGIDVRRYEFNPDGREPNTMLFLGSFRHMPNMEALNWLVHHVMPHVLRQRPKSRLVVIGSDPPPRYSLPDYGDALDLRGYVDDIYEPLGRHAVFVCPILSGSGVRVKLLEAFSCGIPVVSTSIGAEGLARGDGELCALADDPQTFAAKIVWLFDHPDEAAAMARRARAEVEANWDMPVITRGLVDSYHRVIREKRSEARS
jgi:glycosyltransferase involved in cell wall biosynthesis